MIMLNRLILLILLFLAPVLATAATVLGFDDARHLLNRTSFAANIDDINAFARLTREQAVDQLLSWSGNKVATPAPEWVNEFVLPRRVRAMSEDERRALVREQAQKGLELRAW